MEVSITTVSGAAVSAEVGGGDAPYGKEPHSDFTIKERADANPSEARFSTEPFRTKFPVRGNL